MRHGQALAAAAAVALTAGAASAQTYTVSISSPPDLGKVVSAASGDTVFSIDPATGAVTRESGTGLRLANTAIRAMVSVTCGGQNSCNGAYPVVKIGSIGSPTRRARALTNFTVAMGTATIAGGPTGSNPMLVGLNPIPKYSTRTFYVGFDYPVAGDNSGLASGVGASGFYVYVDDYPNTNPTTGDTDTASVTVYRPLSVSNPTGLVFGTLVRPATGSGSVVIDAATGARTSTNVLTLGSPAPSRAAYTVTGEGGQAISITVPTSLALTTSGGSITVNLASTASGAKTLSSAIGSAGSYAFSVGGTLPLTSATKPGAYSASFAVTVQYN
jgi:hypothetical protein